MKVILFLIPIFIFFNTSCGTHVVEKYRDTPSQPPPDIDPPPGDKTDFARMSLLLDQFCVGCHGSAPFITGGEQALRNSDVQQQLITKRMPPNGMPEDLRREMINFF